MRAFSSLRIKAASYRDGILTMRVGLRGVRFVSILLGSFVTFCGMSNREAVGIALPVAGVNPVGYSYYGTALPFVDVAHMSGRWLSVGAGAGGGASVPQKIPLNATAYPVVACSGAGCRELCSSPTTGRFIRWDNTCCSGKEMATFNWAARAFRLRAAVAQQVVYNVTSKNESGLYLDITSTDPANPVRNISLRAPLCGSGNRHVQSKLPKGYCGLRRAPFHGLECDE